MTEITVVYGTRTRKLTHSVGASEPSERELAAEILSEQSESEDLLKLNVAAGPVSRILSDGFLRLTVSAGLNLQRHVWHGDSWSLHSLANPIVSRSTHTDRTLNGH